MIRDVFPFCFKCLTFMAFPFVEFLCAKLENHAKVSYNGMNSRIDDGEK